ncbi:putative mitochondrial DNA helicase twinkle [Forsythia ovata]|uniref:Mitochondrial DNA helicase twinkle n=1 Tax=Forsythia ovata TaxID=205694 RepID=A0ABD1VNQ4_9LAMI
MSPHNPAPKHSTRQKTKPVWMEDYITNVTEISGVVLENPEQQVLDSEKLRILKQKLEDIGIDGDACKPGQYSNLICPIVGAALWTCFRAVWVERHYKGKLMDEVTK